jgi:formylglycine-generating enzyme required for sulfatase activity
MSVFRLLLIIFALFGSAIAAEPQYPLWDGHESLADYAKRVNLPPSKTLDLGNGVKMELVLIPAGKFIMGTPEPTPVDEEGFRKKIVTGQALLVASAVALLVMLVVVTIRAIRKRRWPQWSLLRLSLMTIAAGGCVLSGLHWRGSARGLETARLEFTAAIVRFDAADESEKPAHEVTLTKPFYMGKFAVTQEQFSQIQGSNPSQTKGNKNPVDTVSCNNAREFCKKMSDKTGKSVRLPLETEWEYSCRAGTTTAYYSGDTSEDLDKVAWYHANAKTLQPVGLKKPNGFELYDMHGNVGQWCLEENATLPGQNVKETKSHSCVSRGGFFDADPEYCRSAYRADRSPLEHNATGEGYGFRVVMEVGP